MSGEGAEVCPAASPLHDSPFTILEQVIDRREAIRKGGKKGAKTINDGGATTDRLKGDLMLDRVLTVQLLESFNIVAVEAISPHSDDGLMSSMQASSAVART